MKTVHSVYDGGCHKLQVRRFGVPNRFHRKQSILSLQGVMHARTHAHTQPHTQPHTHKYRTTKEGRPFYQASKARFRASTLLLATSRNSASVSWDHLPSWREVQGVQCGKGSLQEPPFRPIMIGYEKMGARSLREDAEMESAWCGDPWPDQDNRPAMRQMSTVRAKAKQG